MYVSFQNRVATLLHSDVTSPERATLEIEWRQNS